MLRNIDLANKIVATLRPQESCKFSDGRLTLSLAVLDAHLRCRKNLQTPPCIPKRSFAIVRPPPQHTASGTGKGQHAGPVF